MALAHDVAAWIVARQQFTFTRRDCHRAFEHRAETVAELKPVLDLLHEYGYIREAESESTGRRPSIAYDVNPALFL